MLNHFAFHVHFEDWSKLRSGWFLLQVSILNSGTMVAIFSYGCQNDWQHDRSSWRWPPKVPSSQTGILSFSKFSNVLINLISCGFNIISPKIILCISHGNHGKISHQCDYSPLIFPLVPANNSLYPTSPTADWGSWVDIQKFQWYLCERSDVKLKGKVV